MPLKNNIKNSFSKAAKKYSQNAIIQRHVACQVAKLAYHYVNNHDKVLDLGCGTGFLGNEILKEKNVTFFASDISDEMLKQVSHNQIKVNCDFENLSFQNETFDVVLSSFSLQWSTDLLSSFKEAYRVLRNGSAFLFSIPLNGSLQQLRNLGVTSINAFHESSEIVNLLNHAKFSDISVNEEMHTQHYSNPLELLQNIKNLGANLAIENNDNKNNLLVLRSLKDFKDSWNMGYFVCKKN